MSKNKREGIFYKRIEVKNVIDERAFSYVLANDDKNIKKTIFFGMQVCYETLLGKETCNYYIYSCFVTK